MKDARYWIAKLGLRRHPEGGFFRETYRSDESIPASALPDRFTGDRSFSTAIYFLLAGDDFSAFHRIQSDEVWHFYDGTPVFLHAISADGGYARFLLGNDPDSGARPRCTIPAGSWLAAKPAERDRCALVGCTVAPGFDMADFELGSRDELCARYPAHTPLIRRLTR